MEQPVAIAASKVNTETRKKRRSFWNRLWPDADRDGPLARIQRLSTCGKVRRDTKRRMIEINLRHIEAAFSVIISKDGKL